MTAPPPDWQLPPGVSRGLWQYLHDEELARSYDAALDGGPLAAVDCQFVEQHCIPKGRLIDLGCGTGRLLLPLAALGYPVLGVDLSLAMLGVAREKADAAARKGVRNILPERPEGCFAQNVPDPFSCGGLPVDLVQANLVELGCFDDAVFDHAACLFSTLGMVVGGPQRRRVVRHVYRLLRPGGVFVLHVHNRWFNFWQPRGWQWLLADLWRGLFQRDDAGDRHMPAHGRLPSLTLHLFTRREAMRLLREAGFTIREVRPVSLEADGKLRWPRCLGWLRTYGYLIAATKPRAN